MTDAKAYPGSCHCGNIQYQVKLKFPPIHDLAAESIRIYKCNCSTCHKMGYFHCRPINPAEDCILTSPAPEQMGEYRCFKKKTSWYFCKNCGVRVLAVGASWEQVDLDIEKWAGTKQEGEDEKLQKVWVPKGDNITKEVEGKTITRPFYLSVNAVTLEPSEDINLRMWHEKGWVAYVDSRSSKELPTRLGEPHEGGMY